MSTRVSSRESNFAEFWRRHSQVHSSAAIQISVECAGPQQHNAYLYVAPFLRYSRLPQNSPEILSLLSWTAFTGTNGRKQLYLLTMVYVLHITLALKGSI